MSKKTKRKKAGKTNKGRTRKQARKNRRAKIIIPVCILVLLAAIYIAGIIVFSGRMMPNSFIENYSGEYNVSYAKADEINSVIAMNDACIFTISRDDGRELSFELADVKDDNAEETSAKELLLSQPVFSWPASFFDGDHIYNNSSYGIDETKVKELITSGQICDGEPSEDAYISTDEEGAFLIIEEVYGTQADQGQVEAAVLEKLAEGEMSLEITEEMYIKPVITKENDQLNQRLANIQEETDRMITIDMYLADEVIRCGDFFDTDKILEENVFEISEEKVDDYMKYLIDTYDTYETKRKFITHDGRRIKVGAQKDTSDDTYGFRMNEEETRRVLISALGDKEVPWIYALWDMVGNARDEYNSDIGHTYIEISIDEQHLWYFVDGEVIFEADVVTGLPTEKRHTPKGVFSMFWKDTDTRLKDSLDDEHWDVKVDYWLSVTYTGVGIHSAPWQPVFGGEAYKTNGSHGCINVSTEDAKYLYDNIEEGTCIVIY